MHTRMIAAIALSLAMMGSRGLGQTTNATPERIAELIQNINYVDRRGMFPSMPNVEELGRIGTPAVPALMRALDDPERSSKAAESLGLIGPAAKEALPKLIKMLKDPAQPIRWGAARGIGGMGEAGRPAEKELIAALEKCLGGESREVGSLDQVLATAIAATGDPAGIEVLAKSVKQQKHELLRMEAAKGIAKLAQGKATAVLAKAYEELREDKDMGQIARTGVVDGLVNVKDTNTIPILVEILGDNYGLLRMQAMGALKEQSKGLATNVFAAIVINAAKRAPMAAREQVPDLLQFCGITAGPKLRTEIGLEEQEAIKLAWAKPTLSSNTWASVLRVDQQGNVYVIGPWVEKWSAEGTRIWSREATPLKAGTAAAVDPLGGLYVAGASGDIYSLVHWTSNGEKDGECHYTNQVQVSEELKRFQKERRIWNRWADLRADKDGGAKGVGTYDGTVLGGGAVFSLKGTKDKLEGYGADGQAPDLPFNLPKVERLGGRLELISKVQGEMGHMDSKGNVYAIFYPPLGSQEHILAKFNPEGQLIYQAACRDFGFSGPSHIETDDEDNAYVYGGEAGVNGRITKFDKNGEEQWTVNLPGDEVRGLRATKKHELWAVRQRFPTRGSAVVTMFTTAGEKMWEKSLDWPGTLEGSGFIKSMDVIEEGAVVLLIEYERMEPERRGVSWAGSLVVKGD